MVTLSHLLVLFLVLFGLRQTHRYLARSLVQCHIHCPTQLAVKGEYEAPPRGWVAVRLAIQLAVSRLIPVTAIIGIWISFCFTTSGFARLLRIGSAGMGVEIAGCAGDRRLINLVTTFGRLHSRRLREEALKDLRTLARDSAADRRPGAAGGVTALICLSGNPNAGAPR